jgi:isoquinoline 1-oxidoreductase beta subunit
MNRRNFLLTGTGIAGVLMVGWGVTPPRPRLELDSGSLPVSGGEVALNGWLKIATTGEVTIALPRSEMGQGVYTSLPMLLAEELGCAWSDVRIEQAPIDQMFTNVAILVEGLPFHPDDHGKLREGAEWIVAKMARQLTPMITGGSSTISDAWHTMRTAGASARGMLVAAAAQRFNADPAQCSVADGWVVHSSGLKASFGELAGAAARIKPTPNPRLKEQGYTLIGKPVPRLDLAGKVTGAAQFGLDVRLPGMLYASIRMAPTLGGTWRSWTADIAETMPGVKAVVPLSSRLAGAPHGIAVIATQWWQAESALRALEDSITWEDGPNSSLDSESIFSELKRALDTRGGDTFYSQGAVSDGFQQAAKTVEAEYRVPYLAHATMEPQNCTAVIRGGKVEVWNPTQSPTLVQWIAAEAAGVAEHDVTVHTTYLGGGFGRRMEIDMVVQAVELAKQVPGVPVQLIWPREQDTRHDFYRPASICSLRAGLDAQGNVTAWQQRIASGSVMNSLAGRMGLVFLGAGTLPQRLTHWLKFSGPDKSNAEGGSDMPYEFGSQRTEAVTVKQPVPLGFWRSVGHSQNAFFVETFIDELAAAAGKDPYQFRRNLLKNHPRHLAVLDLAATKAGWGQPLAPGMARGIALHYSFGSIVAEVAEVSIVTADKVQKPRVRRVFCAIDCGTAVNPGIIAQQMESGIIFGLTAALYGEITFTSGKVVQGNFGDYPMVRMNEAPEVQTFIVPSGERPGGVGEPATPAIAPAVCNALFALTKKPVRTLPIRL